MTRPGRRPTILFAFENHLPSPQADAEVFVSTGRALAPLLSGASLHVPLRRGRDREEIARLAGMDVVRAAAPSGPAFLRHLCCGLTLPLRRAFWRADVVYTRNLWIAWVAGACGRRVVFDHYRPWGDQVPPLRGFLYRLHAGRRFLVDICHSDYTRRAYLALGIPPDRLACLRNGFDPGRLGDMARAPARARLGLAEEARPVAVYTGRLNHRKGLDLVLEAADRLPGVLFLLVGSAGDGPIERAAASRANVRTVAWQDDDGLARHLAAADLLLIPPSSAPLARFGSTVLPLKVFLYLAAGRPIVAGDTPDLREMLRHGQNALLCRPDHASSLAAAITALVEDPALAARLAEAARRDGAALTWDARAARIAALIGARLDEAAGRAGAPQPGWGRAERHAARAQTRRWLAHLLRTGAPILPTDRASPP